MSLVNMPSSFWRMLTSRFYEKGTRDDGLWHLIRDPNNAWWVNGQVIANGAFFTTGDVMAAGVGVPPSAVGVIFSAAFTSATAGATIYACEGSRNPQNGYDVPLGHIQVNNSFCRTMVPVLFGLTGGMPNGTVRFGAFGGQCTLYLCAIGFIA